MDPLYKYFFLQSSASTINLNLNSVHYSNKHGTKKKTRKQSLPPKTSTEDKVLPVSDMAVLRKNPSTGSLPTPSQCVPITQSRVNFDFTSTTLQLLAHLGTTNQSRLGNVSISVIH